jgi:hypothetical protein
VLSRALCRGVEQGKSCPVTGSQPADPFPRVRASNPCFCKSPAFQSRRPIFRHTLGRVLGVLEKESNPSGKAELELEFL